jgi:hypothetical protein
MKKLQLLFILITTFTAGTINNATAQTHVGKNQEVFIDSAGVIKDHKGTKLAYIDKDNIVRNNKGTKIYFIDDKGNVIDANGVNLGKAKKNGSYYNIKGENVLNTKDLDKEKCAILDPKGHNFGTAHKNYKLHACAAHCLLLEHQKEQSKKTKI